VEFVMRRHAVILAAALAWLVSNENAEAKLDILVDKATQRMLVIQDGYVRYMWPVSTGRDETATPNGIYTPQRLERSWFSTAYYNSPMPYSIFFHNGYAIHGSNAINQLGGPASHGCVRLHPYHASLLFDLVQQEGPARTTIEITDEAGPGGRPLPPREFAAGRGGMEPPPMPPAIVRARPDEPPLPPREFAAGRGGFEPPPMPPAIVRARPDGPPLPPREFSAGRWGFEPPPVPSIVRARPDGPPLPAREMAAARDVEPLMPGIVRTRPDGPPVPGIIRYRETGDVPEPPPAQRADRPHSARTALLSRQQQPAPSPQPPVLSAPPPTRRAQPDVKPPASALRAECAAGEAAASDGSCRPKPRIAEASPPEQPQQAQRTPTGSGMKLLPASCWSGGASRWRWWGSSPRAECK
jgi:L,D-transpeptidase catalytic domain